MTDRKTIIRIVMHDLNPFIIFYRSIRFIIGVVRKMESLDRDSVSD